MTPAYKILTVSEWAVAEAAGLYEGSDVDRADGFIHLSTDAQLHETARKHYAGRDDLMILTLDADHPPLKALIRWEPSRGGALFPHIYGDLRTEWVMAARPASVDADGRLRIDP
ncbi:DUF952 domain-containing protein [Brevundimonas sp. BAL450]|uniref:Glutathione S-transferase domain protein n=1 Tax=Brevundimonas abyssalis TAR-001 TaxID=1391729 RepID=A0A8E0TRN0_9CAUL|nr:DUF952 domain-containing protein [Brevundimonas abyssalis]MBG7614207.1 DUF952 domain-containing protein [Brevundimonas sp. BAL450]GAD59499.1 hypothetical protein MBEBAB_1749 [Brevundimonas abyssalis TAR-001]